MDIIYASLKKHGNLDSVWKINDNEIDSINRFNELNRIKEEYYQIKKEIKNL